VVQRERILVPLRAEDKDLNALYHALSLADRIRARVFVLYFKPSAFQGGSRWWEETVEDVIKGACEEGLSVSYHIAQGSFEQELSTLVREEEIDLIVFAAEEDDSAMEQIMRRIGSRLKSQVIKVRTKNHFSYL